jgi:hypothetical protein
LLISELVGIIADGFFDYVIHILAGQPGHRRQPVRQRRAQVVVKICHDVPLPSNAPDATTCP